VLGTHVDEHLVGADIVFDDAGVVGQGGACFIGHLARFRLIKWEWIRNTFRVSKLNRREPPAQGKLLDAVQF
jgi:hypothetical protein